MSISKMELKFFFFNNNGIINIEDNRHVLINDMKDKNVSY